MRRYLSGVGRGLRLVVRPPLSVTVAALLALCVACAAAPGDLPIKVASSAAGEEVAVYAALLSERFVGPDTGRLVVSAQPSAQFLPDDLPYDLWPELDRAQGAATPIVSSIPSTVPVVLLSGVVARRGSLLHRNT